MNGQFFCQPVTGVQRYARETLAALIGLGLKDWDILVASPRRKCRDMVEGAAVLWDETELPGSVWQQTRLPLLMSRSKADLLWSPCNIGPLFMKSHVVTIHDASVFAEPEWFSPVFRWYYSAAWRLLGKTARLIVTDSGFSRSELIRYGVCPTQRIRVVPAGVGDGFRPRDRSGRYAPYVLSVGSRDPRKNINSILKAWDSLNPGVKGGRRLVVAGGNSDSFSAERIRPASDVDMLGYVPDDRLAELYSGADLFVYPSLYEGFGLPPLEAMASGTPVIVSRTASLPEVCGEGAVYVDPRNSRSIAEAMSGVLADPVLRGRLVEMGKKRAAEFTWRNTAEKLLNVFYEALD